MEKKFNDFYVWLRTQAVGYDIWDRKEEKLYALPVWLTIKENEYRSSKPKANNNDKE